MTFASPCVTKIRSIVLKGEIDPGAVIALQRRIVEALNAGQRRVVVDLSAVTVPGGATLDLLRGALRWLTRSGATLAIVAWPARVHRVLELRAIDGRAAPERERRQASGLGDTTSSPPLNPSTSIQQVNGR